jgi:hypothetical protein
MSQRVKNFLVTTLLLVALAWLGLAIGKGWSHFRQDGYGSSWKTLSSTPKFVNIVDATPTDVWARASDGKLYYHAYNCWSGSGCYQWIGTPSVPDNTHFGMRPPVDRGSTCPEANSFKYLGNPPGNIIECIRAISIGMDIVPGNIVYYALMEDGTIWAWSYSASMLDGLASEGLGLCSGLMLAIIVSITFVRKRLRPMKQESQNQEVSK